MKPDWDKLSDNYKNSDSVQIVDVDCTADGKDICSKVGVSGYPTIKYYLADSPSKPKDYQGGRTYDDLKKFVDKTFKAGCDTTTKVNCNDKQKAIIAELEGKTADDLKAFLKEEDDKINEAASERAKVTEESRKKIQEYREKEQIIQERELIGNKFKEKLDPPKKEDKKKDEDS